MQVRREILPVLVGGAIIYLGHSLTAKLIYNDLLDFLIWQALTRKDISEMPYYMIPLIGVGLAMLASAIFWSFCGGLVVGLLSPRRAILSAIFLAGLFLLPFWWIKALLAPYGLGAVGYLIAASLLLAGAWLGRVLRPRAAKAALGPDMSVW